MRPRSRARARLRDRESARCCRCHYRLLEWRPSWVDAQTSLDDCDDAVGLVEELGRDLSPAAKVIDREETARRGEGQAVGRRDASDDRAIAGVREALLGLVRVQEVKERLRLRGRVAA